MSTPALTRPSPTATLRLSLLRSMVAACLAVVDVGMLAAGSKALMAVPAMCLTANARGAGALAGWVCLAFALALLVAPLLGALRSYRCLAQDERATDFLFARLLAGTGLVAGCFWTGHIMMPGMVLTQGTAFVLGAVIANGLFVLGAVFYACASLPLVALLVASWQGQKG